MEIFLNCVLFVGPAGLQSRSRSRSELQRGAAKRCLPWLSWLLSLSALCTLGLRPGLASAAEDFSPSEQALFMAHHLERLQPPTQLLYSYKRSGSLEAPFEDTVKVKLLKLADGGCCQASAEFLTGDRRLSLPEVEAATANPVILYFLERDIREMSRLTKGQAAYFRKRIRMAVYQGAKISDVTVGFKGKTVPAQRISIKPYADDPLRARFEALADKEYIFTLSQQVPGAVVSIRSIVKTAAGSAAASSLGAPATHNAAAASAASATPGTQLLEELWAEGASTGASSGPP
jgi:hypothetical protein